MLDFIERLRARPEHIRRRIAYSSAIGISGGVAAIWLFMLVASGTLALGNPASNSNATLAQTSGGQVVGAVTQTKSAFSQLVGAAGAAFGTAPAAPAITVEDASTTTDPSTDNSGDTSGSGGNQTAIPF